MSLKCYWASDDKGGGTGALDKIPGADLADKDGAILIDSTDTARFWWLDDDASGSEGETVTNPDTDPGTKSWLLLGLTLPNTGLHLLDSDSSHDLIIKPGSDLSADREFTITTGDAARTITLSGDPTLDDWFDQAVKAASNVNFGTIGCGAITSSGYLACDVVKIHDSDDSHELSIVWNEAESSADRTLNFILNAGNRTIDLAENLKILDGQDIELHASGGEKAQLAIDTQNAERTLDMSENLTVADGYNVSLQALGQANSLILNESLTLGDGHDGTLTFSAASKVLTVDESASISDFVREADFNADTFLYASSDNTPIATSPADVMAALSGHAGAAFDFNSQNLTSVGTIEAGYTGIGTAPVTNTVLKVLDNSVDTTTSFFAMTYSAQKRAGVTDVDDGMYGIYGNFVMDDADSTIGHLCGYRGEADLTAGQVGDAGNYRFIRGIWGFADVNAGTIFGGIAGIYANVDIEPAVTSITGDIYGIHVKVDADKAPTGSVCMLYLEEASNIDYGIYQSGTAPSHFGGDVDINAHDAATVGLKLGGTLVTASAVEINALDGISANGASLIQAADYAAMLTLLSGQATAAFDWNGQNLTGVASITLPDTGWIGIGAALERLEFYTAGYAAFMGSKVGMGTASPDKALTVATKAVDAGVSIYNYHTSQGEAAHLFLGHSLNNTIGSHTAVTVNDGLGEIHFMGSNGTIFVEGARITGVAGQSFGAAWSGRILFYTGADGSTVLTERMKIDESGNVDIENHDASSVGLKLGGTLVTSSAAELNILDGVTSTTAELNQLDDNTLTNHLTLHITDVDGDTEGDIWYDASEDKLKFRTAAGTETITSA